MFSDREKNNQKTYYELHKDKILKKNKGWYNRLKQNKTTKEWNEYRLAKTIAQRKYRENNKEVILGKIRKGGIYYDKITEYRRNNRLNFNGRTITIKKRIFKGYCELCGLNNTKLNYHHWDNNNPAKGVWVCHYCHMAVEKIDKGIYIKYLEIRNQVEELFELQAAANMNPGAPQAQPEQPQLGG